MGTKTEVFISYSRSDADFVEKLGRDLRARGIATWIDVQNIVPGANWPKTIERAIKKASILIFVATKKSGQSAWTEAELSAALANGAKVIPIVSGDVGFEELPAFLRNIQGIDFRTSYGEGLEKLLLVLGAGELPRRPKGSKQPKSKGYVFLSYAEEDADFLKGLKGFLKDHKYAYWDYEESERDYQSQLFLELEGAIIESAATLSVISENWKRSRWAVREYFFSEDAGKPVFLLKAKPMGPTLAVAGQSFIDFTKDVEAGYWKLGRELVRKGL